MAGDKGKALVRALDGLSKIVGDLRSRKEDRLPTIKALSRAAGVAPFTMWKAVRELKRQGVLRAAPYRGIRLTVDAPEIAGPDDCPAGKTGRRWEGIFEQLQHETAAMLPGDVIPQPKELVRRYGTTHKTLARALERMVARRLLTPYKKSFRVPVLSVKAGNSRVVLIAFGINDRIRLTTYRTQDHLRALERACGLHGLLLETCSFRTLADEFAAFGRIDSFGRADDEVSVLGFIVWNVAIAHDELLSGVLRGIGRYGKPIAFLDETGALRRDPLPADIRGVHTWEMATGPASGEATGRFLHNIGHRSVAMLCSGNGLYARERGEGVRRAFRKAGFPDAVRVIGPLPGDPAAGPFPVNVAIDTPGAFVAPASIFIDEQRLLLEHAVRRELARPRYDPLFERALAVPGVSAWVAENDLFAIDALAFLKKRGVRVPQEINVVGFDDSLEASFFHLSSYHFNGEAVINRMLDHVCKPPKSRSPLHSMEIEGFVRERATTCAFRPGR